MFRAKGRKITYHTACALGYLSIASTQHAWTKILRFATHLLFFLDNQDYILADLKGAIFSLAVVSFALTVLNGAQKKMKITFLS
jgi:hypothetical protein